MKNNQNIHLIFKILCLFIIFIAIVSFLKNFILLCEGFSIKKITKGASKVIKKTGDKVTGEIKKTGDKATGEIKKAGDKATGEIKKAGDKATGEIKKTTDDIIKSTDKIIIPEVKNIINLGGNEIQNMINQLNKVIGSLSNISSLFKDLKQTSITPFINEISNTYSVITSIPTQIENKLKF